MAESVRDASGFHWRTSSYSTQGGGNCVEVGRAVGDAWVVIRDTKNRGRGCLAVSSAGWAAFIRSVNR